MRKAVETKVYMKIAQAVPEQKTNPEVANLHRPQKRHSKISIVASLVELVS